MGPIGGRAKSSRRGLVAEINVTPLVDVMLVLLIVFMVAAPMMTQGVDVNLPKTTAKALPQQEDPITVYIKKGGRVFLGQVEIDSALLVQQLENLSATTKEETIYLRADAEVAYGTVVTVMSDIKSAGFDKVGMVTLPTENP